MYHVSYSVFKEQKKTKNNPSIFLRSVLKDPEDTRITLYVLVALRYHQMYAHNVTPLPVSVNPHKIIFFWNPSRSEKTRVLATPEWIANRLVAKIDEPANPDTGPFLLALLGRGRRPARGWEWIVFGFGGTAASPSDAKIEPKEKTMNRGMTCSNSA
jgi:hypothetical protein